MLLEDLALGWVISKLFGSKSEQAAQSPGVFFPPAGGTTTTAPATTPATTPATPAPDFPQQVPVPATAPPAPSAQPGQPAPAGFKRGVEVWIIRPELARQGQPLISGMGPAAGQMAIAALEAQFPKGWRAATSATPAEAAKARSLLPQWKDGGVVFDGPATLTGRRAYRMMKHPLAPGEQPRTAPPVATAPPAATPATPAPAFPSGVPVPTTAPPAATVPPPGAAPVVTATPGGGVVTTLPEVLITADAPKSAANQVTLVRKGEGLANVARRLGQPATATSAIVLQKANLPGPDGLYTAQALDKGGLKKKGRAGGLQPGDRLFVPPQWGPIAAAQL